MNNKNTRVGIGLVLLSVLVIAVFGNSGHMGSMEHQREHFVMHKQTMIGELGEQGRYTCCLEKPCTYCIEKTPKHGEGATCSCLADVMNGKHPCGECMGEIMEGHGNPFLAPYFATAIAEEVGEEHLTTLQQIISEKYGISKEDQLALS